MKESFTTYTVGEKGERPWGTWQVLDLQSHVVVKKLLLIPGGRISLQRHNFRSERWIVTEGVATVRLDDVVTKLKVGQSINIPCGSLHRLSNDGDVDLALIEIQMGDFLSEEDIERFKDDYGRVD
ncbi:MAG: phosphomannose isomerase type II C-terminal cupin domain [Akkermansia sp.]|jgi:mannose-6-phosphate isomerase|nr:phosphomannose isomerase type II C-terminal cupin domain [Akkermansia sp.]